jgi:hypothetical protein
MIKLGYPFVLDDSSLTCRPKSGIVALLLLAACGDIDSCAHAPCQSRTPISHWTAGRFCNGCLGGAGSISQGLRVLALDRRGRTSDLIRNRTR